MQRPYLLPPEHRAVPLASLRYSESCNGSPLLLRTRDRASSLMVDLQRDCVVSVTEDFKLEAALDAMFRLGMRVLLVVRDDAVVGVLSLRDAQRLHISTLEPGKAAVDSRVADLMATWSHVPAIDWVMLQQCCISDLAEIFAGSDSEYLVVLEDEGPRAIRVRGLITRERLDRVLRTPAAGS